MNTKEFETGIKQLFGSLYLTFQEDEGEYGFTYREEKKIARIAFSTNLSLETVDKAIKLKADLLLTHHDAWDFLYGMKEQCLALMKKHNIIHYFVHLPLDFVEFGTCTALFEQIRIDNIDHYSTYDDEIEKPGIGSFRQAISFEDFKGRLETILSEPIQAWQNHERPIQKVAILTGAGSNTALLKYAKENGCDAFVTGERSLYSVQYAKYAGIHLFVGSHTYTEIFGVKNLASKIRELFPDVAIIGINETHLESEVIINGQ